MNTEKDSLEISDQAQANQSQNKPAEPAKPDPVAGGMPAEIGGTEGPEPTRYGDWEHKGRCYDF